MTDTNPYLGTSNNGHHDDSGAGVPRPANQPGQKPEGPASGGEGAAGAGSAKGFGTGE